jgi:dynein intermediate chain 2, axonemal
MHEKMPTQAYIWDVNNPNSYDQELKSPSSVTKLQYNPKLIDLIGGGCYSGLVAFWDVRKGKEPTHTSPIEKSHYDPITSFSWLATKGNSECITSSTDGRVLWWDLRRLEAGPVESLDIKETTDGAVIGGTVLEYNVEAGVIKTQIKYYKNMRKYENINKI